MHQKQKINKERKLTSIQQWGALCNLEYCTHFYFYCVFGRRHTLESAGILHCATIIFPSTIFNHSRWNVKSHILCGFHFHFWFFQRRKNNLKKHMNIFKNLRTKRIEEMWCYYEKLDFIWFSCHINRHNKKLNWI